MNTMMNAAQIDENEQEFPALSLMDRCDRCGAQAYVRAVLRDTAHQLIFCAHHGREYEGKLRPLASVWQDETEKLLKSLEPEGVDS